MDKGPWEDGGEENLSYAVTHEILELAFPVLYPHGFSVKITLENKNVSAVSFAG